MKDIGNRKVACFTILAGLALGGSTPLAARAQTAQAPQVDADIEGKIGGGLLGAELGLVAVGALGIEETWPYLVGVAVGGTGGALLGHFLIDQNNAVEAGVGVMAAGIALAIPALVFAVAASAYDPDDDDAALSSKRNRLEASHRGEPQRTPRVRLADESAGRGLLRYGSRGGLCVGPPSLGWVPMFSREDLLKYGVKQQTELRVAFLSGSF
ncbi:MAG: hypothetical protein H6715_02680 [Myxococcales bacterium]|nr:hypothetical protein [Myxococcales bacterium]MCB9708152.1 hypothetical protein [Myxococcales bacterium]